MALAVIEGQSIDLEALKKSDQSPSVQEKEQLKKLGQNLLA